MLYQGCRVVRLLAVMLVTEVMRGNLTETFRCQHVAYFVCELHVLLLQWNMTTWTLESYRLP